MKFADRVKQTTTATSAATIALSGSVASFRTFAAAFAVGDTGIPVCIDDGKGAWENGTYTLTNGATLTRTSIDSSSNNGAAVSFSAGLKEVFCTPTARAMAPLALLDGGLTVGGLAVAGSISDAYFMELFDSVTGTSFKASVAALKSIFGSGGTQPGDTIAPAFPDALSSSAVTQASFTLAWQAATDANGIARYEYSYDGSTWTTAGTALSVNLTGRTAGTTYTMRVRAIDPAGNISTVRTLAVTTAGASGDTTAPSMSGSITTSSITAGGYAFAWSAGSDNVGVVRYETSIDGGASWASVGTALNRTVTGRPASTTDNLRVRAHDAAGNMSNVLSASVTTAADQVAPYTIAPFSNNGIIKTSVPASSRSFDGGTYFRFTHTPTLAVSGIWTIAPLAASAVAGWGASSTVPPATITLSENRAGAASINGMTPMDRPSNNYGIVNDLIAPPGASGPWFMWVKPIDGAAQCVNASAPLYITAS